MADEQNNDEFNQSVANRVLSAFIAAVVEDEELAEIGPRLRGALLDTDNLKEDGLRKALFGDGES
jgi:hypothetical protein